jgi:hypothetical protein
MILPTFYIVAVDFETAGLGSANDITADRDQAYDDYAAAREDGQPARAFVLEFDVETNALEAGREVTDEFQAELEQICAERGLSLAAE